MGVAFIKAKFDAGKAAFASAVASTLSEHHIHKWHSLIKGEFPGGYDELLADDVIFYSPVVFTPQKGKDLAKLYLMAAGNTFGGDDAKSSNNLNESSFKYTKEVLDGNQAILEFETTIDGKYVNGVDIIGLKLQNQS